MVSKQTTQRRRRNSKRQKRRSLKRRNVKSRKVMGGGWRDKLKRFFKGSSRESPYRVPETTTPQTHEMIIENDRRDQIFELYQLLPTYRYNYTGSQPENMLEATLYYYEMASRDGKTIEEKTIPCMCGIYIYIKPEDIMGVIIKAPTIFNGGWEIDSTPRIHQGDLQLTPISPFKLELINNSVINIGYIKISKDTIGQAIEKKTRQ